MLSTLNSQYLNIEQWLPSKTEGNTTLGKMKPVKVISGNSFSFTNYLYDVWANRSLIAAFARRDLRVQYAQTYLGLLWSILQPVIAVLIFTFFFQRVIHLNMRVPYAVFALTGILGWFYFTQLVGQAGTSLMHNKGIITKVAFPKLILPLAKTLIGLTEFGISLCLLLILMLVTGMPFTAKIAWLPLAILANIMAGLSIGIWLAGLTIRFRDLHHVIPFLIGFGIWITPVFYPTTLVPNGVTWIYYLHPVANVIALYRYIFIGDAIQVLPMLTSFGVAAVLLVTGLVFFIRNEKLMADYL